eukprot:14878697-Ditylum_brightwellii.AAC.1
MIQKEEEMNMKILKEFLEEDDDDIPLALFFIMLNVSHFFPAVFRPHCLALTSRPHLLTYT